MLDLAGSELQAMQKSDGTKWICPLCGRTMRLLLVSAGFRYYECRTCQLAQVAPTPSPLELQTYYSTAYEVDFEGYSRRINAYAAADLAMLGRPVLEPRLLEIGSSWGLFLDFARRQGWRVAGVELSEPSSTWAREQLGLKVTSGSLQGSEYLDSEAFDAAVAWHVIEHDTDPIAFLRNIRSSLKPGGRIALRTPNFYSLPARLNKSAWEWLGAPAHLTLFSMHSLGIALQQTGFRVERMFTRRGDAHNPWFEILRGTALRMRLHGLAKRAMGLNSVSSHHSNGLNTDNHRVKFLSRIDRLFDVALFFLAPLERFCDHRGLGAEIVVTALRTD